MHKADQQSFLCSVHINFAYNYKEPCEAENTKLVNHTLRAPLPAFTMSNKLPWPVSSPVFLSFFLDLFGVTENGFDFAFLAA